MVNIESARIANINADQREIKRLAARAKAHKLLVEQVRRGHREPNISQNDIETLAKRFDHDQDDFKEATTW